MTTKSVAGIQCYMYSVNKIVNNPQIYCQFSACLDCMAVINSRLHRALFPEASNKAFRNTVTSIQFHVTARQTVCTHLL